MSMDRCSSCERLIDTDHDVDCYVDTSPTTTVCRCVACREKADAPISRQEYLCTPKPDPRDPDHSRSGIFVNHNCYRCRNGKLPCKQGAPNRCDYPHARND